MMDRSQPEYSTATVWLPAMLCRCAFSEAGHSVTSGLAELAATRHLASGVGSDASGGADTAGALGKNGLQPMQTKALPIHQARPIARSIRRDGITALRASA